MSDNNDNTELTVIAPLYVDLPRKKGKPKRIYANLNCYRNLHHVINNDTKHMYKDLVWEQLNALPTSFRLREPICVTVTLFSPDKRDRDLGNFCSVAQKYVDDSVVEFGILTDDSVKYVKRCIYEYGGIDSNNPRFEVKYTSI